MSQAVIELNHLVQQQGYPLCHTVTADGVCSSVAAQRELSTLSVPLHQLIRAGFDYASMHDHNMLLTIFICDACAIYLVSLFRFLIIIGGNFVSY